MARLARGLGVALLAASLSLSLSLAAASGASSASGDDTGFAGPTAAPPAPAPTTELVTAAPLAPTAAPSRTVMPAPTFTPAPTTQTSAPTPTPTETLSPPPPSTPTPTPTPMPTPTTPATPTPTSPPPSDDAPSIQPLLPTTAPHPLPVPPTLPPATTNPAASSGAPAPVPAPPRPLPALPTLPPATTTPPTINPATSDSPTPVSSPNPPAGVTSRPVPTSPADTESPPPPAQQPSASPPVVPAPTSSPAPPVESPSPPDSPSPVPPRPTTLPPRPTLRPQTQTPAPNTPTTPPPQTPQTSSGSGDNASSEPTSSPSGSGGGSSTPPESTTAAPPITTTTPAPEPTSTPKRYQRGDGVIVITKDQGNGTTVTVEIVVAPSQAPALVVRDAGSLNSGGSSQDTGTATSSSSGSDQVHSFLGYLSTALAALSLLALIVFNFIAGRSPSNLPSLVRPNQWELLAFITYLQAMASTANFVVISVPAFLWKYLDCFSWTGLLPIHGSDSGIGDGVADYRRRLSDVVVLDGVIAYADRLGIEETDLLNEAMAAFLVVLGALLLMAIFATYYVVFGKDDSFDSPNEYPECVPASEHVLAAETVNVDGVTTSRVPILAVGGIAVVVFAFSLYPVTLLSAYEVASEVRVGQAAGGSLTVALLSLVFVCAGFIARAVAVVSLAAPDPDHELRLGYQLVWGSVSSCDVVRYERRVCFVVAWMAMQVLSAVIIGTVRSEEWQLGLLLAVDVAFLATIVVGRPFQHGHSLAFGVTIGVAVVKILNTSLMFAFATTTDASTSTRRATATAFIVINSLVLVVWFVRLFGMACRLGRERMLSRKNTTATSAMPSSTSESRRDAAVQFVALRSTSQSQHTIVV